MLRHIHYVSSAHLPSKEASAVHIAHMCDAFVGNGIGLTLYGKRGERGSVSDYYGLKHSFAIHRQDALTHRLWLLRRQWSSPKVDGAVWFGRRPATLARLGCAGYPVALELHQPPHTPIQIEAVGGIIRAPRFLGLVVISHALETEMRRRLPLLGPEDVLVAHDCVRSDRFREPTVRLRPLIRAIYCGTFHRGKGIETVLQAARRVPHVQIDVMGGTPEQIRALRPEQPGNVRFLGHLPHAEAQRRLPEYDLALAPYGTVVRGARGSARQNNLAPWMSPLKLFEYVAAGLPIVTSNLPVLREILRPERDALMTQPADAEGVAAAIARLAADAGLRLRLALSAQAQLHDQTWERRAAAIADFLARKQALNERQTQPEALLAFTRRATSAAQRRRSSQTARSADE